MESIFSIDSPLIKVLTKVVDLFILNFIFLVFSIPIVTIGASVTALYSVILKMVQNEEEYILKGFIKAFKENFKISTFIWVVMLSLWGILICDFRFASFSLGFFNTFLKIIVLIIGNLSLIIAIYIFPYMARFQNVVRGYLKNTLLISILNLHYTIIMLAIDFGFVELTFWSFKTLTIGLLFWPLVGFAVVAYANSFILRKVFGKYEFPTC